MRIIAVVRGYEICVVCVNPRSGISRLLTKKAPISCLQQLQQHLLRHESA